MSKFSEINIGDRAEITHKITKLDIDKFVELTGDNNKIHVDSEFASTTPFKKPVVHGMLGASFISTIIGTKLPGDGALWYSQSLEFLQPVRVGDTLKIEAVVTKKFDKTQAIELMTNVFNQHNQKVTEGSAKVKVVETAIKENNKNENNLQKSALVIGGTGGIGTATCMELAKEGFNIAIHYHSNKIQAEKIKNEIIPKGIKAFTVTGNLYSLTSLKEIKDSAERALGDLSVVVNCSSIPVYSKKFSNLEWNDLQSYYDSNIKIAFNLIKVFLPSWEKNNFGKFIGISTLYSDHPKTELLGYISGKAALNGFAKALAVELAPKGIRINLVSPGMVDTSFIADVPEKVRLLSAAQTPLRRLATPEDIANAISFLASEKSNYLTGETLRVNGGQFML